MRSIFFAHPAPAKPGLRVVPVFLPYSGCPYRCIYCSQERQSNTPERTLDDHFTRLSELLDDLGTQDPPLEIAFYGGTFTQLPGEWAERFVARASSARHRGPVRRIRCSTRPDGLDSKRLALLKELGLDTVELGVQSFQDRALSTSRRGYTGCEARDACHLITETGLDLGIQLMPGMPGSTLADFLEDIDLCNQIRPSLVRLYPCQVLSGTVLARMWERRQYRPWPLTTTLCMLGLGVSSLWKGSVPVARLGLAPEHGLAEHRLAGPWHPALGFMVRSRLLGAHIVKHVWAAGKPVSELIIPRRFESEVYGHRREQLPLLERNGIPRDRIRTHSGALFQLVFRD